MAKRSPSNVAMTLTKIERFDRVNIHRKGDDPVEINGVLHFGATEYFGAVWFEDANGQAYVSFVKKTTKLWQTVRTAEVGTSYSVKGNFKDHRKDEEIGDRIVLTHVRLS